MLLSCLLLLAQVVEPSPAPVEATPAPGSWVAQLITLALIPLAGLFGSWCTTKIEEFKRKRDHERKLDEEFGPQRRKDDPRITALEERLDAEAGKVDKRFVEETARITQRFDTVEGLQHVQGRRLADVEQNVEQVKIDVGAVKVDVADVKEYMHESNHTLRNALNVAVGRLETVHNQLMEAGGEVRSMSKVVDMIHEALLKKGLG